MPKGGIVDVVYRHRLPVRLMHWINALCLFILLMSGLNIFMAHPALYWGPDSSFDQPWISIGARDTPNGTLGITQIGDQQFVTTGVLGVSKVDGHPMQRAFHDTYSLEMTDIFADLDLALRTYRHAVSTIIPTLTRAFGGLPRNSRTHVNSLNFWPGHLTRAVC